MCGRYSLGLPRGQIHRVRGWNNMRVREWRDEEAFEPRHNIAPRSRGVVMRRQESDDSSPSDCLIMQTMKWGLVPHWSKHEDKTLSTSNARAENLVSEGGMWASIKGRKRCVVICEGYFEWLKKGKDKLPYFTRNKDRDRLMLLAGLYDCVTLEGESEPLWTFTIVTTDANSDFSWLHDRQPVILSSKEAVDTWLDTSSHHWSKELTNLVQPYSDQNTPLECYQVPKEVGKVGTESDKFIEPVVEREDGIKAMFAKQQTKPAPAKDLNSSKKDHKRKRNEEMIESTGDATEPSSKQPKVEKVDAWEDEDSIEYIRTETKNEKAIQKKSASTPKKKKASALGKGSLKNSSSPSGTKTLDHFFARG